MAEQMLILELYERAFGLFSRNLREAFVKKSLEKFRELSWEEQVLTFVPDAMVNQILLLPSEDSIIDLGDFLKKHSSRCRLAPGTARFGAKAGALQFRLGAAEKLLLAEKNLQLLDRRALTFKITDAYRPLALQRLYFEEIKKELQQTEGLEGDALYQKAHMIIADPDIFPPHSTGGAIDLTIVDLSSGEELDMGTSVDAVEEKIFPFVAGLTFKQQQNRILLFASMLAAGFANYPCEWWHFSYGDKEWALRSGRAQAIYASR